MGAGFFDSEVAVAHFEHVGVVMAAEVRVVGEEGVEIEDTGDIGPVCLRGMLIQGCLAEK